MASYEAFFPIVTSQLDQYLKFLDQARNIAWRPEYPALNLLATSTCWRQDHNGFSHQNPALISHLLAKPSGMANCLFPIDTEATEAAWRFMMRTKDCVNLMTVNKTDGPQWIDSEHAKFQLANGGASIFQFASDEKPAIIVTAAGDIVSREALYAMQIVRAEAPEIKMRFVGLAALTFGGIGTTEQMLGQKTFDEYFLKNLPIVANFHGYPGALEQIFATYGRVADVRGYVEQGSTTTPFDMLARNRADRYSLAIAIFTQAAEQGIISSEQSDKVVEVCQNKLARNADFIKQAGIDLEEIAEWKWKN
jgi:xylulose-5-phosphate/fructose-6-phosphate phosphoketolase